MKKIWPILIALVLLAAGLLFALRPKAPEQETLPVTIADPAPELAQAHELNGDTKAWLSIPGTGIDLPVQHAADNDYYLRRNAEGKPDEKGCVFADYECDLSVKNLSRNLIFYGHTFDGDDTTGFAPLHQYRAAEFGSNHPYIYVSLENAMLTYQVFSTGVCDAAEDADCIIADPDTADFQIVLDKAMDRCPFNYGVTADVDDHILTLSTCTNSPSKRYLVVAKLVYYVEYEGQEAP